MKFWILLSVFLNVTIFAKCRSLWSVDLDRVNNVTLEKGKPIQLSSDYQKVQFCDLSGTIYSDSFSQLHDVTELRICSPSIQKIEKGALCSAPNVKILDLSFYEKQNIPRLTKDSFENCNQIEELILRLSWEHKIEDDAFENLKNLKKFQVQGYNLNHFRKNFIKFSQSSKIHDLAFSYCNIQEIDEDAFENFENLKELSIVYNRNLTKIPKNVFKNNPKLEKLVLMDNGIKELTWDEFQGLDNLEKLNLIGNRIESFDADKIAENLPKLKELNIEQNPPRCKVSEAFVEQLKSKVKHPIEVSFKFDPGLFDSCEQET